MAGRGRSRHAGKTLTYPVVSWRDRHRQCLRQHSPFRVLTRALLSAPTPTTCPPARLLQADYRLLVDRPLSDQAKSLKLLLAVWLLQAAVAVADTVVEVRRAAFV